MGFHGRCKIHGRGDRYSHRHQQGQDCGNPAIKFIVTGDVTQIDLPRRSDSGLTRAMETLKNIDGIGIVEFDKRDIVRHHLVKYIVEAFDKAAEQAMPHDAPMVRLRHQHDEDNNK